MKIFVCCSARDDIKEEYLVTSANLLDKIFQDDNDLIFGADNTGIMKLAYNAAKKYQRLVYGVCPKNYIEDLFLIKTFASEAEYYRQWIPFMYDGIVVSYLDNNIRQKLGRENFINKYSIAVKFNPMKKQTIFRGYSYTVGQD